MGLKVRQELEILERFLTSEDAGKSRLQRGNARELSGLLSDYVYGIDTDGGLVDFVYALRENGKRRDKARKAKR